MLYVKSLARTFCPLVLVLLLLSALAVAGCGEKDSGQATLPSTVPPVSPGETSAPTTAPVEPGPATQPSGESSDIDAATDAALKSARANNPDIGKLKVLGVELADGWARVDMQPVDESTDRASWLLKKVDGLWTVIDYGTSLIPSDHPDAPAEVFD